MKTQKNFILPLRNSEIIPSKPPLSHWLSYLSTFIFGDSENSIRLPAALISAFGLALFFLIFSLIKDYQTAALSTLLLGSSFDWIKYSTHFRVDIFFSVFLSAALFLFYLSFKNKINATIFFAACLALALAGLCKGPAAFVLVLAILASYYLLESFLRLEKVTLPKKSFLSLGVLVSALPLTLWYYLAYCQAGFDFLEIQLLKENIARAGLNNNFHLGHEKAWYYSLPYFLLGFLPWSLFIFSLKNIKSLFLESSFLRFCFIICFVFILAVTISSSKRSVYFLPAYPALSFLLVSCLTEGKGRFLNLIKKGAILTTLLASLSGAIAMKEKSKKHSPKNFALDLSNYKEENQIYQLEDSFYALSYYIKGDVLKISNLKELKKLLTSQKEILALAVKSDLNKLKDNNLNFKVIKKSKKMIAHKREELLLLKVYSGN